MPSTLGWTIKKGIIVFLMKPSTFLWTARKGFQYFWLPLSSMRGTHPRRAFRYSWVKHKQWAWWPKPLHCDSRSLLYYWSTIPSCIHPFCIHYSLVCMSVCLCLLRCVTPVGPRPRTGTHASHAPVSISVTNTLFTATHTPLAGLYVTQPDCLSASCFLSFGRSVRPFLFTSLIIYYSVLERPAVDEDLWSPGVSHARQRIYFTYSLLTATLSIPLLTWSLVAARPPP